MKKEKRDKKIINVILIIVLLLLFYWYIMDTFFSDITFDINVENIELKVGEKVTLDYELSKKVNINWESDSNIVSIDNGVVTANSVGNAKITGTIVHGNDKITRNCYITTYYGEKNVSLNDVNINGNQLFITKGDSYSLPINYSPVNSYVYSIDYHIKDTSIVDYNGSILAKNTGIVDITIEINKLISKTITVNVLDEKINPVLTKKVNEVIIDSDEIVLMPNEESKIAYKVEPPEAIVKSVKLESNNNQIVSIVNDKIVGKKEGNAVVSLIINDQIVKKVNVVVGTPITKLNLLTSPKIVLKVGNKSEIKTIIEPSNASNVKLEYTSSSNNIQIDENGVITPIAVGNGTITVKTKDGNYKNDIAFTVNPKIGVINSDGGIWGYSSSRDSVPTRADEVFFKNLAINGKGTLSNNVYTYSDGKHTYKYSLKNSTLEVDGRKILMRIYYPQGVDLSMVNTFTFFGGVGEVNLNGYFSHLDSSRNEMISSGIIIIVSGKTSYYADDGILSTEFVKSIVNQKSGVKNAIGGYSASGPPAGIAANSGLYDRLIIFDSYIYTNANSANNLKNLEIIFYSPVDDAMLEHTLSCLNNMLNGGYNNVTIISNNSKIINNSNYSSNFLIINPGDQMGRGHGYVNITKAKVFSYTCS